MKQEKIKIALVGNPNCGKTTIFNQLTGLDRPSGNWPGVTVEKFEETFEYDCHLIQCTDLPGCYSTTCHSDEISIDEQITSQFLFEGQYDLILNVIDAENLQRHLYLTMQLRSIDVPMVIVINKIDVIQKNKTSINLDLLSEKLHCDVLGICAHECEYYPTLIDLCIKSYLGKSKALELIPDSLRQDTFKITELLSKTLDKRIGFLGGI